MPKNYNKLTNTLKKYLNKPLINPDGILDEQQSKRFIELVKDKSIINYLDRDNDNNK